MPLALNKIRSLKFTSALDLILYLLENVTEEKFWQGILGERLTRLGQRYFGNDFVVIGILFYIAPILRTNWQNLVELCMDRMAKRSKTVSVRVYYYDEVYNAINYYVMKNTEQLPGLIDAVAMYEESRPNSNSGDSSEENKPKIGFYPRINTTNQINYNGHKLSISTCNDNEEKCTSNRPDYLDISMETSASDSIDSLKNILQDWCDLYNDNEDNTIKILRWDGYESWVFKDSKEPRGYDSVNLPPNVKENLLADMTRFIKRRKWYQRKGLPHRRGFLLYGPPGTGKTSLIQALAGKLKFDLALVKLGEVRSDSEFSLMVSAVPKETLLVIEDVDHYDESNTDSSVSKSGLLNGLDGINGNDGTMVFMTCNDMNKITPALLRPGRMDVKLELGYAVHHQMEAMFWRFFGAPDLVDDDDNEDTTTTNSKSVKNTSNHVQLPPTPPSEDEQEEDQERKLYLETSLKKLLDLIPEHHVTTAELQNLFVTLFLEVGPNQVEEKVLLDRLLDRIPDFLERVQSDREQAKLHDKLADMDSDDNKKTKKKNKKDGDNDDSDSDDDADTKDDSDAKDDAETKDDDDTKNDADAKDDTDAKDDSDAKDDTDTKDDADTKGNIDTKEDTVTKDDSDKKVTDLLV